MVLWFIFFLSPAILSAGTIHYVDETPDDQRIEEDQVLPPRPPFPHPQLEPEYQIEQDYYFREQNQTEKIIYRKDSSFMDLNYAWAEVKISEDRAIQPDYATQNYTETNTTTTTNNAGDATTSETNIYVSESFSINSYGDASITFPTHEDADPTRQPAYQFNAVTRNGHFGYGIELSYHNNATLHLTDACYTITQTQSSTTTTTTTLSDSGATSVSSGIQPTIELTTNLYVPDLNIKVVDVPINFTVAYFPIYDGYIQPYFKAGLGINMTYTTMDYRLPAGYTNPTGCEGTFAPFYIEGWSYTPFSFTYGGGVQVMISESWAMNFSYLWQRLDGKTPAFKTIASNQDETAANKEYGYMRFKFKQKATVMQLGMAYYF